MNSKAFAIMAGLAAAFVSPQFALAGDPLSDTAAGVNQVMSGAGNAVTGTLDKIAGKSPAPMQVAGGAAAYQHGHHHHHHHHHH